MNKIVIIGGVAAGTKAAAKIKRLRPDYIVELYTDDDYVSYSACGMPYFIEGTIANYEELLVRSPEKFKEQGVDIFLRHKCIKIIPHVRNIVVEELDGGKEHIIGYDKLIIATGAHPFMPPIKNSDYENIYMLRHLDDGIKIKNKMLESQSVTLVGGGYIAIELIEAFITNNLKVNVVTDEMYLMSNYDYDISKLIQEHVLEHVGDKITLITNDPAIEFEGDNRYATKVITQQGQVLESDFIVVCAGVFPNTQLAKDAGLELGARNSIRVDNKMQTSNEHIYAAGDCCEKTCLISKGKHYMGLGSIANKEGRVAAINVVGENEDFPGILISTITRFFKYTAAMVGLTEKLASRRGYEPISVTVTKRDRAGYMPNVADITVKIVVDKKTRKILGAQAVGFGDVDKRITTMAAVILGDTPIEEFLHIDLPYSPPFSSVIDVLHVAGMQLMDKFNKLDNE